MTFVSTNRKRGTLQQHAQLEYAPHAQGVPWNKASAEVRRVWIAYVRAVRECWELESKHQGGSHDSQAT